jgi:Na+/melibiose symporter-like transporter
MEKPSWNIQIAVSSLAGLVLLYAVLMGSLWAQVEPYPPGRLGPFIAASLCLAVISIPLVWWRNKIGYTISIIVGLLGVVSFSPLKFFYDESAGQVIPVIVVGTVLVVALIISSVASWRTNK